MAKIAFVSTMDGVPWGGSEELWAGTAACLANEGVSVSANVVRWLDPSPRLQALEQAGCRVTQRIDLGIPGVVLRRVLPEAAFRWLDRVRPDLLVISQGSHIDGLPWMEAASKRGIPYAPIAQSASETFWPDDDAVARLTTCYEGAAAAYFVSEGNLALTRVQLASPIAQAEIVRNPFQVPYRARPPWPSEAAGFQLACVARLAPHAKGQDLLLQVLAQEKWRARPCHVSFYGEGPNRNSLERLAQQYGLENVTFCGYVSDVQEIWKRCHALVLPSRYEGLPLAVVEAMLCGRPCIVSDVAGNAELLQDNSTGFVASAPTMALLDDAMDRAWALRYHWEEIGARAATAVRLAVPEDPIAAFAGQLNRLLAARRRGPR